MKNIISSLSFDLPVNTVCVKPSNRNTEISQKVHSSERQAYAARDLKFGMYLP